MQLQPREIDRLLLYQAAELARSRRARGLLLNAPEAIAIISDTACEAARDGATHAEAAAAAHAALGPADVLPGVPSLVGHIEVEALFTDGSRLLLIVEPLGPAAAERVGIVRSDDAVVGVGDVTARRIVAVRQFVERHEAGPIVIAGPARHGK